jgi:hypothetical protein
MIHYMKTSLTATLFGTYCNIRDASPASIHKV